MARFCVLALLLFAFAMPVAGQDKVAAKPVERTVILDIRIVEIDSIRVEDFDRLVKEEGRLDSMIADGKARALAGLEMRTRSGEQAVARIGQRVPIYTATIPVVSPQRGESPSVATPPTANAYAQINYENVGLSVTAQPRLTADDQIEVKLSIDANGPEPSTGTLAPTFVQRNIGATVILRQNEPTLLFGVVQNVPALPRPANSGDQPARSRGNFLVVLTVRLAN